MKKTLDKIYVVKKGDTLASIASLYKINSTKILLDNAMTPNMIKEGTPIFIDVD